MDLNNLNKGREKSRKKSMDLSTMVYGKVPPQAKDLEEAVLGAVMLERDAFDKISDILKPESFYVDAHQRVFRVIQRLQQRNMPVDILLVMEELKVYEELETIGGPYFLTKLTANITSSANIVHHARIIQQKYIQRELIRIAGEIINDAYEDSVDVFDLLDQAEEGLLAVGTNSVHSEMISVDSVLAKTLGKIEEWRLQDTTVTGVPSGFPALDRATRGWQPGDLIILAARPSVGKTAIMLNFVRGAVNNLMRPKATAAIWSLEMKSIYLNLRQLAAESGIILHRLQTGRLEEEDMKTLYKKGVEAMAKDNIFFDDSPNLTLMSLRSKARRLKKKKQLEIIFVDYLQLMSGTGKEGNREQEIAKISRGLKQLALELEVPIIALSQLSRELEGGKGPKRTPRISDLRESGAIEQDADVIMLLWGPDDDEISKDPSISNRRFLKIAKQRNGVILTIDFEFDSSIQKFMQLDQVPQKKGGFKPVPGVQDLFDNNQPPM